MSGGGRPSDRPVDARGFSLAIVATRWHEEVTEALVASAVAAFFYLRIVVLMYFSEPADDGPTIALPSPLTMTALAIAVAATVILGVIPQPLLDLADKASLFAGN